MYELSFILPMTYLNLIKKGEKEMEKQMEKQTKKRKIIVAVDCKAQAKDEVLKKIRNQFDVKADLLIISLKDEITPIIIGVDYYILSIEEFCKNFLRYRNVKIFLIDGDGNWDGIIRNIVPPQEEKISKESKFRLDESKIVIVDQGLEKDSIYKILVSLEDSSRPRIVFCKETLPESLKGDLHIIRNDTVIRAPFFYRTTPFVIFGEDWVYNSTPMEDLVVENS